MDNFSVAVDLAAGTVTVVQTAHNGIVLAQPLQVVIAVDVWLSVAAKLIEAQVEQRKQAASVLARNGR